MSGLSSSPFLITLNKSENAEKLVDIGNNVQYVSDLVEAVKNEPDSTNDGYDNLITNLSIAITTAELVSGVSGKSFHNKDLNGHQMFFKTTTVQAHALLISTSTVNAFKHFDNENYHKAISNGFVALSSSIGIVAQMIPETPDGKPNPLSKALDVLAFGFSVSAKIADKGEVIADGLYNVYQFTHNAIHELKDKINKFADEIANDIKNGISDINKKVTDFTQDLQKNIKNLLKNLSGKMLEVYDEAIFDVNALLDVMQDNPEKLLDLLPDSLNSLLTDWLSLNRSGKHYFYDPLILDLDGDGIETIGHNKKQGAMFELRCVNNEVYELVV